MAKSTRQVKNLASTFSGGKAMEIGVQSKFVEGSEGGIKRKRIAGKAPEDGLPSSASIFSELTGLPTDGLMSRTTEADGMKSSGALQETNIGFKLLKKSGWKEGSGLGISEQGRLNPLEPQFKSDRSGIGAEKDQKRKTRGETLQKSSAKDKRKSTKEEKNLARRARKMKAEEEKMLERELELQFYREFLPENM